MSAQSTPAPAGGGMRSLYANLLEPEEKPSQSPLDTSQTPAASISANPDDCAKKTAQQLNAAALRFQPLRRPGQQTAQKPQIKTGLAKLVSASASATATGATATTANATSKGASTGLAPTAPATKFSAEDWVGEEDDDGFFAMEKRQRGGRKKRKKNREEPIATNWDETYDPSRPTNLEEWLRSDARMVVEREWKERLYAHRMTTRESSEMESSEDERIEKNNNFAPPPGLNFAPPPNLNDIPGEPTRTPSPYEPPSPSAAVPNDVTGDDAFARRMQLIQTSAPPQSYTPTLQQQQQQQQQQQSIQPSPPARSPPSSELAEVTQQEQIYNSATISRAPVRYELPPAPPEIPTTEAELEATLASEKEIQEEVRDHDSNAPRSLLPGQKGFAARLLSKYGWTEGTGLGATGSGIVKPLQVKVEKAKKRPDSEGGGFVGPTNTAKIIGGKKLEQEEEGKFGAMSNVIVLSGMIDGMDVEKEMTGANGGPGLMQEIGEECGSKHADRNNPLMAKYGRVERVYIDQSTSKPSIPVFVKFTSQLSALRAVNALEGRIFNGNKITARFFDSDKFESGVYQ
ncbi:hypothetical protein KEM54_006416 [Ascosphaera aggregata]|nr:hypothetical protein KEM54_006416 [Ascosphaera aggregata]